MLMKYRRPSGSYVEPGALRPPWLHSNGKPALAGFAPRHGGSSSSRFSMPACIEYRSSRKLPDNANRPYSGGVLLMQYLPFYDAAAIETLQGFEHRAYEGLAD